MKSLFGLNVPTALSEICRRDELALLIYDMQIGIAGQIKAAETIIANIERVLEAARDAHCAHILYATHVVASGAHGRISVANGDGMAES